MKYGSENFKFILIEKITFLEDSLRNEEKDLILKEREQYYIDKYNTVDNSIGYNLQTNVTKSPMFGRKHSPEARKKMSEWQKGQGNNNYKREFSESHKKKISESKKGEKHPLYQKKLSEEQKQLISSTLKNKGHKPPKEAILNSIKTNSRKVVQLSLDNKLIKVFDSISQAGRLMGVNSSCIRDCCTGRQKTSCGYKWMYIENYEVEV